MAKTIRGGELCAIARTVDVLRDPWTFLVLREALSGVTRFAEFRDALSIATDVLTDRLNGLVEAGILQREHYQEPGRRTRTSYHVTPAGAELKLVIGALQQWGDTHLPVSVGPTVERRHRRTEQPLQVAFVASTGRRVNLDDVDFHRTPAYPS